MRSTFVLTVLCSSTLVLSASAALAREAIRGEVYDPAGALIPEVLVRVVDRSGNVLAETTTARDGRFDLQVPAAHDYQIRFDLAGFRPAVYARPSSGTLIATMLVAQVAEFVEVRAPAAAPSGGRRLPLHIHGGVVPARRIHAVEPEYPVDANASGVVILLARIDARGNVADATLLKGHPALSTAALDAVRQWRYRPMLLNGEPWPSELTVTVRFIPAP